VISNFFQNKEINNEIKKFLEENLSKKNCKFKYFIINKRNLNEICIINNYPKWFDFYIECNHQMVDPVVIKSLSRVKCFSWNEDISTSSKLALPGVMQEAKNTVLIMVIHLYCMTVKIILLYYLFSIITFWNQKKKFS